MGKKRRGLGLRVRKVERECKGDGAFGIRIDRNLSVDLRLLYWTCLQQEMFVLATRHAGIVEQTDKAYRKESYGYLDSRLQLTGRSVHIIIQSPKKLYS